MNIFKQSFSLSSLRLCQPCRPVSIDRSIVSFSAPLSSTCVQADATELTAPRVNCSSQLPYRPFSTREQCRPNPYARPQSRISLAIGLRRKHVKAPPKTYFQKPKKGLEEEHELQRAPPKTYLQKPKKGLEEEHELQRAPPKMYFQQPREGFEEEHEVPQGNTSSKDRDMGDVVVLSLVLACAGIFVWCGYLKHEFKEKRTAEARDRLSKFYTNFTMTAQSLKPGHYYTLITSTFMHADIIHLGLCMMGLYSFGRAFTAFYGVRSFLAVYFGSGVAGGIAQGKYWESNPKQNTTYNGVGSSGAISGLFAAIACAMPRAPMTMLFIPLPMAAAAIINVVVSIGGMQGRWLKHWGHADHLGGMAFGVVWWVLAMRRGAPLGKLFRPRF
ncbi:hypothetical protein VTL71DRAFT_16257 [Oculimacula yallundae]|uniref:Peptidase S54 rhomboid domain-containing protein n=1 Tax=Oculimacula yallundae TaxID=86028 RepID=A0ABR4CDX1_9HELO